MWVSKQSRLEKSTISKFMYKTINLDYNNGIGP